MRLLVISVIGAACSSSISEHTTKPPDEGSGSGSAVPLVKPAAPVVPGQRLPDLATPLAYDLRLEIDPSSDAFRGTVAIRIELAKPTDHVWLHAEQLVIDKASYAGTTSGSLKDLAIPNDHDMRAFSFGKLTEATVTISFAYTGKIIKDEAEGLFRQQAGGKWYVYAQAESLFARRITPSFDEPRWKPSWKVTLVVPDKLVAIGNGGTIKETVERGRRVVELAEVARMPSYLLSIAVGPFQVVDVPPVGRNKIPTRVIVPAGNAQRVGVVPQKLPAVVEALEAYLDRPLPLAKLDLVAVPEFFGAMENPGLITFQASLLIGDPKSSGVQRRFVRFVAHELAHQWFGNLVTQSWWDDLWLAEGFATWLGDRTSDQLGAYADPAMRRQLARLHALASDDEATPRPLRRPTNSEDVQDRFDAIAYEKGGALLEMMEEFAGHAAFQAAIRAYVTKHEAGSVTSKDVVTALSAISPDVAAALTTYLDLGGAPVVSLKVDCATRPTIEVRTIAGTVPVCVRTAEGRVCVAASSSKGTVDLRSCPTWVIGNAGGDGYYRIADPTLAAKAPTTPSERLTYANDLAAALLRGDVPLAVALGELERLAKIKDTTNLLGAAIIAQAIRPLITDDERAAWTAWLTPKFTGVGRVKGTMTGVEAALARDVWQLLPSRGPGKPWFDKVVARAKAAPDAKRADILDDLGGLSPEHAPAVIELALTSSFRAEQVVPAIAILLARPTARTRTWKALQARLPRLIASVGSSELEDLVSAAGSLCDAVSRAEVVAAFTDKVPKDQLAKPLASIDRCIARRSTLGDLRSALKSR